MEKRFWMLLAVVVLFAAPGCTPDTDMYGLDGAAGAAGSAGEAGSGGSGGSGDECTPDGMERDCECPDGADGTQTCEDGEFGECECEYYPDDDGDGYGDENSDPTTDTEKPAGHAGNNDDCDDGNASTHPGADEVCDGEDNDCDGKVDEGDVCGEPRTWYEDADGDSYGNPHRTKIAVEKPAGYVSNGDDCDDTRASIHPGAVEVCNNLDDDCDGQVDEGGVCDQPNTWHRDQDGDGYGDPNSTKTAVNRPSGYVADGSDCDDTRASIHPGAAEVCNNLDDDCDGQVDEGGVCDTPTTWYADDDGDGYGDPNNKQNAVEKPAGYVSNGDDCDDTRASIHPGAAEVCNNLDDDCDGQVDEGGVCDTPTTWYADDDGDGYGDPSDTVSSNSQPSGYVANADDCDDDNANRNPGMTEICDNDIDDDCDGLVDEDCGSGGGTVTLKFEVDCSAQSWVQSVQPEGSWAGRNYGALSGCVSTGTRKTACTFEIPAPDFPTFVGQGDIGFGRYSGDASGNAPAPCYTPSEVEAMQGHAITLLCTHRLWKDGQPVEQVWESNGVIKPDGTQSCSDSGPFPYYNSRPLAQTAMQGELTEPLTESQMIGARFEVVGKVFYWMGGESLASGWRSLETLEPNDIIWLGSENPHVRMYFPSLFSVE